MNELQASIRRHVADHDVHRIQLWFTDILGELDMVEIPASRLESLMSAGALPNDSSTSGFGASSGSDTVAVPDWSTFRIKRGPGQSGRTASVFCHLDSDCFSVDERWFS